MENNNNYSYLNNKHKSAVKELNDVELKIKSIAAKYVTKFPNTPITTNNDVKTNIHDYYFNLETGLNIQSYLNIIKSAEIYKERKSGVQLKFPYWDSINTF